MAGLVPPPDPRDYEKQLTEDDKAFAKEVEHMMKVAIFMGETTVKVRTFPKGKPEDFETAGSTVAPATALFMEMYRESIRDGKLKDMMNKGRRTY